MRKSIAIVALVALAAFGGILLGQTGGAPSSEPVTSLGMAQIKMGPEFISRDGQWLLAFVPSGSKDKRVLVSISGHWVPNDTVGYLAANMKVSDTLGPGVQIYAHTDSGKPFPKDTGLIVTILQPGAKFGEPRPADKPLMPHP